MKNHQAKAGLRRILMAFTGLLAVVPLAFAHYYLTRMIANPTTITSTATQGTPTTTTQWYCVNATGTAIAGGPWTTQALAEAPCGTAVAGDGVTRYLEERITTTVPTATTKTTRRIEIIGGTTLKVSDANAAFINVSGGSTSTGSSGGGGSCTGTEIPIQGGTVGQCGATGYAHTGVSLSSCESYVVSGDYVLDGTSSPLTVDGCDFSGKIVEIRGNVSLKRSRVKASFHLDCAAPAIYIANGAGPVLIEDVEVTTGDTSVIGGGARQDRWLCVDKNNTQTVTINRVYAHDTMRGVDVTGQNHVTIQNSYLGPNVSPPVGQPPGSCLNNDEREHASSIRGAGASSDITVSNTVLHIGYCSWASGLIANYPESGANHDWTITGGRWIIEDQNSGGYGIAVGCSIGEQENYNFTVNGVQISTQYYSDGCPSGCDQSWTELAGTNVWTGVTKYNPGQPDHGNSITAGTTTGGSPGACPG